jgi:hypothetical protein
MPLREVSAPPMPHTVAPCVLGNFIRPVCGSAFRQMGMPLRERFVRFVRRRLRERNSRHDT